MKCKFALLLSLLVLATLRAQVPDPVAFFGHEVGADRKLIDYRAALRWFEAMAAATDRVRVVDIGDSSYGQRMVMVVVTSPANLQRLERLRAISERLAHGRLDDAAARALADEGRAVVWIDAGLHASEAIAGQNLIELVWQLASRDDDEARRIRDEVVLLACPVNPDGLQLIASAYAATGSMALPVLYQRYVGHDNNRDYYACNQPESRHVSRVLYRDWCPQVLYNHHQTAPKGTVLFTPPFRDPFNYHVDPMVVRGIELLSAQMNERFAREGKPGVISRSGAPYSAWWNGGLRSTAYFHNCIGILTEAFGRPEPTQLPQPLERRLPTHDYPDPVPAQLWHARQTIDYLQTANFALLDHASRHRRELLFGMHTMAMRAVGRGSADHWTPTPRICAEAARRDDDSVWTDPEWRDARAYVLPLDQRDGGAVRRFAASLWHSGIELHRLTEPVAGAPAGSLVVRCDQPYRAHVLDMFEPQWHPDDLRDGKPVPPYDTAGWTPALQTGVRFVRLLDLPAAFDAACVPFGDIAAWPAAPIEVPSAGSWLDAGDCDAVPVVQQLLAAGERVLTAGERWYVPSSPRANALLAEAARQRGLRAVPGDAPPDARARPLRPARFGLFDVLGGHMATGWTEWLLRDFGFAVPLVFGERIVAGDLRRDFDALIFHTGLPGPRDLQGRERARLLEDVPALQAALPPFEDWSTVPARAVRLTGESALPALREFVAAGGTLIALGAEVEKVVRHFELPVEVGVHVREEDGENGERLRAATREEFYVPGSLLWLDVDVEHPLARGMPAQVAAMFGRDSHVLTPNEGASGIEVVARFRAADPLASGWAIGADRLAGRAAVLSLPHGEGRIVLFGIDAVFRGQPLQTAKVLFQAVMQASGR